DADCDGCLSRGASGEHHHRPFADVAVPLAGGAQLRGTGLHLARRLGPGLLCQGPHRAPRFAGALGGRSAFLLAARRTVRRRRPAPGDHWRGDADEDRSQSLRHSLALAVLLAPRRLRRGTKQLSWSTVRREPGREARWGCFPELSV